MLSPESRRVSLMSHLLHDMATSARVFRWHTKLVGTETDYASTLFATLFLTLQFCVPWNQS